MKHSNRMQNTSEATVVQLMRKDWISAQLVEIGIVIQKIQGTALAEKYLRDKRIDPDVAGRVLSQPFRRRTWREHGQQ